MAKIAGELCTFNIGLASVPSDSVSKGTRPVLVCLAKTERRGEELDGFLDPSILDKARLMVPGGGRPRGSILGVSVVICGTAFKLASL